MKLVVITPETLEPRETAVLAALFAAGLERCHVRKPSATRDELAAWLRALPARFHARLVLHQHHDLAGQFGLGGRHWRDDGNAPTLPPTDSGFTSRSCHDLASLRAALGHYDSICFGPVFPSLSKPGHGPRADFPEQELAALLATRTVSERRTTVLALGGITAKNIPRCRARGFDGVAVLGTIWQSADPVAAFRQLQSAIKASPPPLPAPAAGSSTFAIQRSERESALMCITLDGLSLPHAEQARQLCAAGARWIQLRMKNTAPAAWLATAREVVAVCRAHRAVCIINDSVDIALASEADGAHLGSLDLGWREARARLGPNKILGGTVNNLADAARAREAGCLDYVGIGPLRFTTTKQKLAPVLGLAGVSELLAALGDLPAWVIGGVEPADLPSLKAAGASGVAVSSALFRDGRIAGNFRSFNDAWATPVARPNGPLSESLRAG